MFYDDDFQTPLIKKVCKQIPTSTRHTCR